MKEKRNFKQLFEGMVTRYTLGSVGCGVFVCILCGIMKCSINVASHAGPAPCITVLTTGAVCVCMFLEFSNNYFDFENVKNHLQIFRTDCTLCLSVELGNLWCSFTPTPFYIYSCYWQHVITQFTTMQCPLIKKRFCFGDKSLKGQWNFVPTCI
jgi:hypothetical protein